MGDRRQLSLGNSRRRRSRCRRKLRPETPLHRLNEAACESASACESAGKVTPGRRSKGPPFPAGRSGCKPTRALSQPCHLRGAERQRFKRRQPACGVCAVTSNGRVARAGGAGQAVRVPGEADRLPQSRPNPRGGSTLSSAERSSVHISSSLCAVADSPRLSGRLSSHA